MDTKALLEQLLESGRKMAEQGIAQGSELAEKGKEMAQQGVQYAKDQLPPPGPERDKLIQQLGVGAAAGGLLAFLVGTKAGRNVLSPAVKLGSLAALGGIGYKVYTQWQQNQGLEGELGRSRSQHPQHGDHQSDDRRRQGRWFDRRCGAGDHHREN